MDYVLCKWWQARCVCLCGAYTGAYVFVCVWVHLRVHMKAQNCHQVFSLDCSKSLSTLFTKVGYPIESRVLLAKLASHLSPEIPQLCLPCSRTASSHHICLDFLWDLGIPFLSSHLPGSCLYSPSQLSSQWEQFWLVDLWNWVRVKVGFTGWQPCGMDCGQFWLVILSHTIPKVALWCVAAPPPDLCVEKLIGRDGHSTQTHSTALWTRKPKSPMLNCAQDSEPWS